MEPVESIRRQFFSLSGVSYQPQQGFHQPGIVFRKEFFKNVVGVEFQPGAQK